jgi:hypothetical protein
MKHIEPFESWNSKVIQESQNPDLITKEVLDQMKKEQGAETPKPEKGLSKQVYDCLIANGQNLKIDWDRATSYYDGVKKRKEHELYMSGTLKFTLSGMKKTGAKITIETADEYNPNNYLLNIEKSKGISSKSLGFMISTIRSGLYDNGKLDKNGFLGKVSELIKGFNPI